MASALTEAEFDDTFEEGVGSASLTRGVDVLPSWLDLLSAAATDCITGTVMWSGFLDRLSLMLED
jgi:hypothetical protein